MENSIKLSNIDGKIWSLHERVLDIISILNKYGNCYIELNGEGPCASSLGLYQLLDNICDRVGIEKNKISIHTCNQIESHQEYHIKITPPLYIKETQQFAKNSKLDKTKSFNEDFCWFGIFIGRSNWIRLWLAGDMYKKYHTKLLMTYHWRPRDEFHAAHIGLDEMLVWNATLSNVQDAARLLEYCPMDFAEQNIYPILSPAHLNISKLYHRFLLEVVCETYYSGTSFYPTEKIWRPLSMRTPFIVHGPVDYLKNLKKLGFKTFNHWWSEEYDDYGHDLRIQKILNIIDDISKYSSDDLKQLYNEMTPILDHNHRVFMNLTNSDFNKAFNYV